MIKTGWTTKITAWVLVSLLLALSDVKAQAQRVPRPALAPVKQARGQKSGNEGMISFSIIDTNGNAVRSVLFYARRTQDEAKSGTPDLRLLKNGNVISLPEGVWTVSILPNRDYPYSGDVEVEVAARKLLSILLQVERIDTSQLRVRVSSDEGQPLKAYVSSLPVNIPSFALQGVTDINGTSSICVPMGEPVILTAEVVDGMEYRQYQQGIVVNEPSKSLAIALQSKNLSAICTGYFLEEEESSDMPLTDGKSHIAFSRTNEPQQERKAYAYEGKFRFYDLDPGEYVIKTVSCRVPYPKESGQNGFYRTQFAPTSAAKFVVDDGDNTTQIGAVGFNKWPSAPGMIRGRVSGLEGDKEGLQVTAFRIDSKGNRLGQEAHGLTDVRGRFKLQNLVSGLYDVEVSINNKTVGQVREVVALPVTVPLVSIHCTND